MGMFADSHRDRALAGLVLGAGTVGAIDEIAGRESEAERQRPRQEGAAADAALVNMVRKLCNWAVRSERGFMRNAPPGFGATFRGHPPHTTSSAVPRRPGVVVRMCGRMIRCLDLAVNWLCRKNRSAIRCAGGQVVAWQRPCCKPRRARRFGQLRDCDLGKEAVGENAGQLVAGELGLDGPADQRRAPARE